MKTECLRVIEPNAAPANIATTAAIRCCKRGLVPRTRDESAAMPVMVNVSTVVVRSGTASLRTAAFLIPIAMAVKSDHRVKAVTPHNEDLEKFSHDGSNGQPYVAHLPGHSELT